MWEPEAKHRWRRGMNAKHKQRDRYKGTLAKMLLPGAPIKFRRFRLWARDSYRRKAAPATGFGVAYE